MAPRPIYICEKTLMIEITNNRISLFSNKRELSNFDYSQILVSKLRLWSATPRRHKKKTICILEGENRK